MKERFQLLVRVQIQKVSETGGYLGENLSVTEESTVGAGDFLEVCGILGRFHELTERVKAEHKERKR